MIDRLTPAWGLFAAALVLSFGAAAPARAQCASCGAGGDCCGRGPSCGHCPPAFVHYYERPPKIKFKPSCPRPVCDPCNLEHYGYYQTCWCSWPFPPDMRHCPCAASHPAASYLMEPAGVVVPDAPPAPVRE
jgi:hypothetical protein